jgi:hypothetical protein
MIRGEDGGHWEGYVKTHYHCVIAQLCNQLTEAHELLRRVLHGDTIALSEIEEVLLKHHGTGSHPVQHDGGPAC